MKIFKCNNCSCEVQSERAPANCPQCQSADLIETPPVQIEEGARIAGFRLIRKIGGGGMGEVWLAEQIAMSRHVALKILSPALSEDEGFRRHFAEEIRHSAKMDHPNIVTALDAGISGGFYYLASSYVKGESLLQRLSRNELLPEDEAVRIAIGIASALSYAWKNFQMVHRDIKPSNIIIDNNNTPKLLDLGLSCIVSDGFQMSLPGEIAGTPYYMSPEQARSGTQDFRSDMYSLGITLYHLTTGTPPFNFESVKKIMEAHVKKNPAPLYKQNPNISRPFSELVLKMMAKKIEERPQSWDELIENLKMLDDVNKGAGKPSSAVAPGSVSGGPDIAAMPDSTSYFDNEEIKKILSMVPEEYQLQYIHQTLRRRSSPHIHGISILFLIVFALTVYFLPEFESLKNTTAAYFADKLMSGSGIINWLINYFAGSVSAFIYSHLLFYPEYQWEPIAVSGYQIIGCTMFIMTVLWSAFWSADTAEMTGRNRLVAFIFGFFVPGIYPYILCRKSRIDLIKLEESIRFREIQNMKIAEKSKPEKETVHAVSQKDIPDVPFSVELYDGKMLEIITVFDMNEKFLEAEILSSLNERMRARIPFDRMKSITSRR